MLQNTDETKERVELSLSLHPEWKVTRSNEDNYKLAFLHSQIAHAIRGRVTLKGYEAEYVNRNRELKVSFFIRNATDKPVRIESIALSVLVQGMKVIASDRFNLEDMDEISPFSSRPWEVTFKGKSLFNRKEDLTNWKLRAEFISSNEMPQGNLEISKKTFQRLSDKQIEKLARLAKNLPPIQAGKIQLIPINIKQNEEKDLNVLIFIRNGLQRKVKLGNVHLSLVEGDQELISKVFDLQKLEVKPGTTKPWNFKFESDLLQGQDIHRDRVKVKGRVENLEIARK